MIPQRVWVERETGIIHFVSPFQPYVFAKCGKGFSSGGMYHRLAGETEDVTCLACLAAE